MGVLYVKDEEALRLAQELASDRGLTKTAAVKLALFNELGRSQPRESLHGILAELRRTSTLPKENVGVTDKAFFDSLYGD